MKEALLDILPGILKEILTLLIGGGIAIFFSWVKWGKKKENKEKSEFVKDTFNNYDEMAAKYLERLDTHAEHIHRLQEALMKSRHDDGKKKMHIQSIVEIANKHLVDCNSLDEDFTNLLKLLNNEYANG